MGDGLEERLIKDAKRNRQALPQKILNQPELLPGLQFYFSAFLELSTCRYDGPIPWTAIVQYAEMHGVEDDHMDDFRYYMREMDAAYLKHQRKVIEDARPA